MKAESINKKRKPALRKGAFGRSFIVNQSTCLFNENLLEAHGWESVKHENHIYDWWEYEKSWLIQDEDGSRYKVHVSLRQHENIALLYVNGAWVGRCLYLREAENVVKAIKRGCR